MRNFFRKNRFVFVSPWLLAAAIGLLLLIIFVFTLNNLRREQRLMDESLLHKGLALVRFVGAGTRASMMMGPDPARRVQRLMEQAALEQDIVYLALIDRDGRVLAHSDPRQVGTVIGRDLGELRRIARGPRFTVRPGEAGRKAVFEVVSPFRPFAPGPGMPWRFRGAGGSGSRGGMRGQGMPGPPPPCPAGKPGDWCCFSGPGGGTPSHLMLVGLDMAEQAAMARQNRFHLILMAAALLLVGAGGWFSLLIAQGYRVSQETLRQMKAFTGLLISRLPVGIIATGPDGRVKTWNRAAATLAGEEPGREETDPAAVLPPALAGHFPPGEAACRGEMLDEEVTLAASGGERLVEASSLPIRDEEGSCMGRVLLLNDVTAQRRLEWRLRRQQRFAALGKMAAGVAHEVRNPLSSIKGIATLLGSKFPAGSQEAESARILVGEVERLNRAITELLDFARPLPLRIRPLALGKLIGDSLALVRSDAEALGITIRAEVPDGLPPLPADPDRLNQVLLNLYLNAIQAMEGGGLLTVRGSFTPGRLVLTVEDTGCGIQPGDLDRIFDPYFTTKASGTGLGLAMVQKIVEEHGGQIGVESGPGRGTRVVVELPVEGEG
ncbi:MAG: ATP-binding protein [Desulfobacteraceae bacterium]|nr:ATP-binding protein [Desulfobacteraceae bacterium]